MNEHENIINTGGLNDYFNKSFSCLIVKSFMEDISFSYGEKKYNSMMHFLNENIDRHGIALLQWKVFEGLGYLFHLHFFVQIVNDYFSEKRINIKAAYRKDKHFDRHRNPVMVIEFKRFIRLDYVSSTERDKNKDYEKLIKDDDMAPIDYLFDRNRI